MDKRNTLFAVNLFMSMNRMNGIGKTWFEYLHEKNEWKKSPCLQWRGHPLWAVHSSLLESFNWSGMSSTSATTASSPSSTSPTIQPGIIPRHVSNKAGPSMGGCPRRRAVSRRWTSVSSTGFVPWNSFSIEPANIFYQNIVVIFTSKNDSKVLICP